MPKTLLDEARVSRQAFAVTSFAEAEEADRKYWRARTPDERLEALELSRQIAYGYDPTTRGLSRFFEVAAFPPR
ncbi:MAG TPA: hypothetical protein PKI20_18840 [Verrucomicrobiota bacterium]|nr:hypothetical protein [Verrucomicrobiota bacterium]HQL79799.1 hypothetical protein [Verrucomicrobiota bacterium]